MKLPAAGVQQSVVRKALDLGFGAVSLASSAHRHVGREPGRIAGRTLVILLEGLGDSLAFTPAMRALRKSYPNAHIDLLVNPVSYEVFRTSFDVDNFLLWRDAHFSSGKLWSLARSLRASKYEIAITPSILFRHISLTYLAGSRIRAGFDVDGRGVMLNTALPLDRERPRVLCYLDLVRALGAEPQGEYMELEVEPVDELYIEGLLGHTFGSDPSPLVVIHPGTRQDVNRWLPERYGAVADWLESEYKANVAFTGAEGDREVIEEILSTTGTEAVSFAGKTTLRQLAALLKRCSLLIVPDTGAMHLGSAVNVPMIVLMGGRNNLMEWMPPGSTAYVIRREVPCSPCHQSICQEGEATCMTSITVGDVIKGVHVLGVAGIPQGGV